ncbi:carboxymuconolactone decarboxylase family protein [Devosia ginsengisoli]|uniref:Carboxymuconolactone decarboxylase family protein n=1 Tax=Devosia ginsengisoli TaxID=400770 RepID=A0A5B8LVC3_9HYPH|nr:carboxymuconolactone decarboxylase family protein [Devosia ginsengisoli]QDZ11330.1 carboxymuconolactone decarboxylase family protein [Devosia ginsengisoli]
MQARMKHPVFVIPEALQALQTLGRTTAAAGPSAQLLELVNLRASQINGCSICVQMHSAALRQHGETDERIFAVGAWRETPFFTPAERAALALAEAGTRIADHPEVVTDEIWEEAARHYDEAELAALVLGIAGINLWNRVNGMTRQPVQESRPVVEAKSA